MIAQVIAQGPMLTHSLTRAPSDPLKKTEQEKRSTWTDRQATDTKHRLRHPNDRMDRKDRENVWEKKVQGGTGQTSFQKPIISC